MTAICQTVAQVSLTARILKRLNNEVTSFESEGYSVTEKSDSIRESVFSRILRHSRNRNTIQIVALPDARKIFIRKNGVIIKNISL